MERKLRRIAGNPVVVEFSLASQPPRPSRRVADPNRYYEILGLAPSSHYTQADIKAAYREQAKLFHPDGSTPDAEVFDMIQTAYEVLYDPQDRERYDSLDGEHVWLDRHMTNILVRKLHAAGLLRPVDIVAGEVSRQIEEHEVGPRVHFDSYCYYYYEGEEVPEEQIRNEWIEDVKAAMWERGIRGQEAKVGFTIGSSHVIERPWGRVLVFGGDPSVEEALVLVDFLGVQPTSEPKEA